MNRISYVASRSFKILVLCILKGYGLPVKCLTLEVYTNKTDFKFQTLILILHNITLIKNRNSAQKIWISFVEGLIPLKFIVGRKSESTKIGSRTQDPSKVKGSFGALLCKEFRGSYPRRD